MIFMFTQDLLAALFLTARRGELFVRASEFDNEFISLSRSLPSEFSWLLVREAGPLYLSLARHFKGLNLFAKEANRPPKPDLR